MAKTIITLTSIPGEDTNAMIKIGIIARKEPK